MIWYLSESYIIHLSVLTDWKFNKNNTGWLKASYLIMVKVIIETIETLNKDWVIHCLKPRFRYHFYQNFRVFKLELYELIGW